MSNLELIEFHNSLYGTFIVCPCCNEIYRATDSHLFLDKKPKRDWLESTRSEYEKLDRQEQDIKVKLDKLKESARQLGREQADEHVALLDNTFGPLGLNPNDSKNICNPVDFLVFNGMHSGNVKNLVFLDKNREMNPLQDSIRFVIENELYDFKTLRIEESGNIIEE